MNLSDTFYIALCMTVLILGVVYWFWTQNQYIQRKLNLLENIVYEMKTSLSNGAPDTAGGGSNGASLAPAQYPPAPSSVLGEDEDLLHEKLAAEYDEYAPVAAVAAAATEAATGVVEKIDDAIADFAIEHTPVPPASTPAFGSTTTPEFHEDDLQPGGVGSGIKELVMADMDTKGTVLESMTISELKRIADQRGIQGASKLRKKELIEAIRAVPAPTPFDTKEATLELS